MLQGVTTYVAIHVIYKKAAECACNELILVNRKHSLAQGHGYRENNIHISPFE